MQKPISLQEALTVFSTKDKRGFYAPFDISFRTFNENSKQGGRLKIYKGVRYLPEGKDESQTKSTNHFENRTRNIELSNGEIRKVRIDFIISINNQLVIY